MAWLEGEAWVDDVVELQNLESVKRNTKSGAKLKADAAHRSFASRSGTRLGD